MRRYLLSLIAACGVCSAATSYYVDNAASGANDGSSWTDAFTNLTSITWSGINPDSVIYISGGSSSKTYTNALTLSLPGTPAYTATNWLTFRVGQDSGHNGKVIFDGTPWGDAMAINFWSLNEAGITIDGSVGDSKNMIFQNMYNRLNKNYKAVTSTHRTVFSNIIFTNVSNAIMTGGDYTINDCEFYVRGDSAVAQNADNTAAWGSAQIYSNVFNIWIKAVGGGGPDGVQIRSYTTVRNNTFRAVKVDHDTISNHHDSIQCIGQPRMVEVYGNDFVNFGDAGITIAPSVGTDGLQDIRIYNNIFRQTELIDNIPEYIRFTTADKTYNGFYKNIYIVNNVFVDHTNASTSIVSTYREYADAGIQGTNNWIANNIWVNSSRNAFNPMVNIWTTNNPSVWTVTNNVYHSMSGSPGWITYYGANTQVPDFISAVDPSGQTNLPSFVSYSALSEDNNFRLLSTDTVARENGLDFSDLFTTDFDGNTRSGTWDIGPFQHTDDSDVRYVATTGNDSDDGSSTTPWLTVQYGINQITNGQTLFVLPGTYDERPTTAAHGTSSRRIVIKGSGNSTIMKGLVVSHSYVTLQDMKLTGHSPNATSDAVIKINAAGTDFVVSGCTIGDDVWAAVDNSQLNSNSTITSAAGDFEALGFQTGQYIALQRTSSSDSAIGTGNRGPHLITGVSGGTITVSSTLTNQGPQRLYITAANRYALWTHPLSARTTMSSCVITNLGYAAAFISGTGHTIQDTYVYSLRGWDNFVFYGNDHTFARNFFTDADGGIEMYAPSPDLMEFWPASYTNIVWSSNWVWQAEGVLSAQKGDNPSGGLLIANNIFVDCGSLGIRRPNAVVTNNVFLRSAATNTVVRQVERHPMSIFANLGATNTILRNNIFVDSGQLAFGYTTNQMGWYSITGDSTEVRNEYNYVSGPSPTWAAKDGWTENAALNGGDPGFVNIDNPLGADGIPWTADDGLRLATGSKLIAAGFGGVDIGPYALPGGGTPPDPEPDPDPEDPIPDPPDPEDPRIPGTARATELRVGTVTAP